MPFKARFSGVRWLVAVVIVVAAIAFSAQLSTPDAQAFMVTRQWTGLGGNGNWTNPANWGGTAPLAGEILLFPAGTARLDTLNDFPANTNFQEIVISGPGFTLTGNAVNLTTGLSTSHSSGTVTVNLVLAGPGGVVTSGDGRLILSGANTFSGPVSVNQGVLRVRNASALGSTVGGTSIADTARIEGGLEIEGSLVVAESFTLAPSLHALLHNEGGQSVLSANLQLPSPVGAIDIPAGRLTINGAVTGGSLVKYGGGELVLNGNVAGDVDLRLGVTTVNGAVAGEIDLGPDATLTGTGSAARVVATGGLFAPGSGIDSSFTVNGTVELGPSANFGFVLAGTGYSQLLTSGRPSLGGARLLSNVQGQPPPLLGTVVTIIRNDSAQSVLGTFKNLPEGAVYTDSGVDFRVSYFGGDGNDVTLTVLGSLNADLSVTVSTSPEPVAPGGVFTYTIVLTNAGPSDATSVQLLAPVTEGVSFVSAGFPASWACTVPAAGSVGQLRCARAEFPSGETSTFTLTVRVDSARTAEIAPRIVILSSTPDPLTFNNQAEAVTHISGTPVTSLPFKRVLPMVSRDPG